jgi:hypothetical protein
MFLGPLDGKVQYPWSHVRYLVRASQFAVRRSFDKSRSKSLEESMGGTPVHVLGAWEHATQ